jgi:hypothetical protein
MNARPHRAPVDVQLQARGVPLDQRLRRAVHREILGFAEQFPGIPVGLQVRLFAAPGGPTGPGCGCLLQARVGRARLTAVASGIDPDAARAVRSAFYRLAGAARGVLSSATGT